MAAGRYDKPRNREGPFRGTWQEKGSLNIALDRTQPMPIREAKDDVSSHNCHDMAGNGEEWTNSVDQKPNLLSDLNESTDPNTSIVQRGRSYKKRDHPFLFKSLEEGDVAPAPGLGQTDSTTSFRVVLNPNE